jgi:hypothetical protein
MNTCGWPWSTATRAQEIVITVPFASNRFLSSVLVEWACSSAKLVSNLIVAVCSASELFQGATQLEEQEIRSGYKRMSNKSSEASRMLRSVTSRTAQQFSDIEITAFYSFSLECAGCIAASSRDQSVLWLCTSVPCFS